MSTKSLLPATPESTELRCDVFGCTNVGRKRQRNQDQFLIADLTKAFAIRATSLPESETPALLRRTRGQLMLVADGMGGHRGGETASSIVAKEVVRRVLGTLPWCFRLDEAQDRDFEDELIAVLEATQERVQREEGKDPSLQDMGTTLTMGYLVWPRLYLVHVGDSRCYLLRDGKLEQLTTDHTVAQKLVENGVLEPEDVPRSQYRHVLWNAIGGGSSDLEPEVSKVHVRGGDRFLFCSDGLTGHVGDDEIRRVLHSGCSAEDACRELERAALEGGGSDNVTVIVCGVRVSE